MLFNTGLKFNIDPLVKELDFVVWDDKNRCDLNRPAGHWLYDPYIINDRWRGSSFESMLLSIPYEIGEARLMKLKPGDSYCSHADVDDRYHLNLTSNEHCYLIDLQDKEFHNLSRDNYLYRMDAGKIHTACNFGDTDRIQLVIRIPLKRYTGKNFVTCKIEFENPVFNLRYMLDNNISSFINQSIKNGDIGYFNPINDTLIEFHISPLVLDSLVEKIKKVHKWIKLEKV